jgi:hypothetical protein
MKKLIPTEFLDSIREAYKLTQEWVELKIRYGERQISGSELRRLWDVDVTGQNYPLNLGLSGHIGYVGYAMRHPISHLEATVYHMLR